MCAPSVLKVGCKLRLRWSIQGVFQLTSELLWHLVDCLHVVIQCVEVVQLELWHRLSTELQERKPVMLLCVMSHFVVLYEALHEHLLELEVVRVDATGAIKHEDDVRGVCLTNAFGGGVLVFKQVQC